MKITCYANPKAKHQYDTASKFVAGLKAHGISANITAPCRPDSHSDLVLAWGLRNCKGIRSSSEKDFINMERAYVGDRFNWISLGYNDLNNRAEFYNKNAPSDRWDKHFVNTMKEWNPIGDHVLLTLQVRGDNSLNHVKVDYQKIVNSIRKNTDLPILIRDHPHRKNTWGKSLRGKNIKYTSCDIPISEAVRNAKVVVTVNSNSGVDAILEGTPVINLDNGSMVWDLAMQNDFAHIDNPLVPDRTQWAYDIAYTQWLPTEIESGEAWEHLKQRYK